MLRNKFVGSGYSQGIAYFLTKLCYNRATARYPRNACVIASAILISAYQLSLQIMCLYYTFVSRPNAMKFLY